MKPILIEKWLPPIYLPSYSSDHTISFNWQQYMELCGALLNVASKEGVKLFERIKKIRDFRRAKYEDTNLDVLLSYLFEAPENEDTANLWDKTLDTTWIDYDTLEIAIINQKVDNQDWLYRKIERYIKSEMLIEKVRGINLLGLFDADIALDRLNEFAAKTPNCWISDVIETAKVRCAKNLWAKKWFSRFLESEDDIKAWAAFNLFLKCVDRRFWLWHESLVDKFQHLPFFKKRDVHLKLNWEAIKNQLKDNEKSLKGTFLGVEIEKGIRPWD